MRSRKLWGVGFCFSLATISLLLLHATSVGQQPPADDPFGGDAQTADSKASPPAEIGRDKVQAAPSREEAIRQALDTPADLDFDEVPWADIEEMLEERYQVNIALTHSARDDSLTEDEPFTVNLRGVRLRNALRLMLKDKNATYVVRHELIMIISLDDVEDPRYFIRRIVDVSGILRATELWHQKRMANVGNPNGNGMMGMGGMDMGMGGGGRRGNSQPQVDEGSLTELVRLSVQPEAWRNNPYRIGQNENGEMVAAETGLASCNGFCGHLIINGPEQLLNEVDDFLRDLEASLTD